MTGASTGASREAFRRAARIVDPAGQVTPHGVHPGRGPDGAAEQDASPEPCRGGTAREQAPSLHPGPASTAAEQHASPAPVRASTAEVQDASPDSCHASTAAEQAASFTPCLHGFPLVWRQRAEADVAGAKRVAGADEKPTRWLEGREGLLPAVDDQEGPRLPTALPPVIDAHVHLFPERVFEAIWRWFDRHGWPIRYRLQAPGVIDFLLGRGVEQVVALHYSHKPGMARSLNRFIAGLTLDHPRVHGLATVLPGEPDAPAILAEAFELGLKGVKLHCHVQRFSPDDPHLAELYAVCEAYDRPLVMHAGREPSSAAYGVDTYALCNVERTARVLRDFPRLKLCIPHLGADEFEGYGRLLERHDTLWLDTTMALAGYFPVDPPRRLLEIRPDRILYGTDFPNIPYAWDREVRRLIDWRLPEADLAAMLGENARALYDLPASGALSPR